MGTWMLPSVFPSLAWWVHLGFHQKTFVPVRDLLLSKTPTRGWACGGSGSGNKVQ